jgi:glycosyltransferase involved in cell wall biosynthesis
MSQLMEHESDVMGEPPLVSVIVPTFNRAALLRVAIASVLCQSCHNLEVVVVDDGSRDATPAVVMEIAEKDKRVRYFRQKNRGVSAARNAGLAKARGQYVAFLDSDDAWLPWKLKLQMDFFRQFPQVGMVWTNMDAIDIDGHIRDRNYLRSMYSAYNRLPEDSLFAHSQTIASPDQPGHKAYAYWGNIYTQMLFGNLVHTSTVVLRSDWARQVGGFDESLKYGGEDYKFHLATTRLGSVAFLDVASIQYRVGCDDQITNARNQIHFASAFLKTLQDELRTHRDEMNLSSRGVHAILASAHDWMATASIESGRRTSAARHAIQALWLKRGRPVTAWKTLAKTMLPQAAINWVRSINERDRMERETAGTATVVGTASTNAHSANSREELLASSSV